MRINTRIVFLLAGLVLGAVITGLFRGTSPSESYAPNTGLPAPSIAGPETFQIERCVEHGADYLSEMTPCLLIQAGGKRLLFGAPLNTDWRTIGALDAVFLFDSQPLSSAGLTGLRYETWFDGRTQPLLLVSGELFLETVRAMDEALFLPDAISQVERPNRLDSRQAGFAEKPVPAGARDVLVFNTGDLQVFANAGANEAGDEILSYRVDYAGKRLDLYSCQSRSVLFEGESDAVFLPAVDRVGLTEMRTEASAKRLTARLVEIERLGRVCPAPRQALEIVERLKSSLWIAPTDVIDAESSLADKPGVYSIRNGPYILYE